MNPSPSELATFAGGCFWCMEPVFANANGVLAVRSGFMGGYTKEPSYEQVCTGTSGHVEVIQLTFDPANISYEELLDLFWKNIDPFDPRGQFADKGSQYLSGIFTHNEAQQRAADASKAKLSKEFGKPIESFVKPASGFYPADENHQQYYLKNPMRYSQYSTHNGRKERLKEVWQKDRSHD